MMEVLYKICQCKIAAKSGNASNLISHLRRKHPSIYAQTSFPFQDKAKPAKAKATRQISITTSFAQGVPYDRKSKKWNKLTKEVTYCIVKDGLPLRIVEKDGFKRMLKKFDPRYELDNYKIISRYLNSNIVILMSSVSPSLTLYNNLLANGFHLL